MQCLPFCQTASLPSHKPVHKQHFQQFQGALSIEYGCNSHDYGALWGRGQCAPKYCRSTQNTTQVIRGALAARQVPNAKKVLLSSYSVWTKRLFPTRYTSPMLRLPELHGTSCPFRPRLNLAWHRLPQTKAVHLVNPACLIRGIHQSPVVSLSRLPSKLRVRARVCAPTPTPNVTCSLTLLLSETLIVLAYKVPTLNCPLLTHLPGSSINEDLRGSFCLFTLRVAFKHAVPTILYAHAIPTFQCRLELPPEFVSLLPCFPGIFPSIVTFFFPFFNIPCP